MERYSSETDVPKVPFPPIDSPLLLRFQSFSPFPLIYSPDRPLRLVSPGCEISSGESDNLINLLWRVDKVPGGKERRRVWINAIHVGIS